MSGKTTDWETDDLTRTVGAGDKLAKPTDPMATDGSAFLGWYTDAACTDGQAWSFDTAITENKTLYAKWSNSTRKITVKFRRLDPDDTTDAKWIDVETYTDVSVADGYIFSSGNTIPAKPADDSGKNNLRTLKYADAWTFVGKDNTTYTLAANTILADCIGELTDNTLVVTAEATPYITVTFNADTSATDTITLTAIAQNGTERTFTVTAKKITDADRTYKIAVANISGGTVTAKPNPAAAGEEVKLTIEPNDGKKLVAGSLKYSLQSAGAAPVAIDESTLTFIMPAGDININAQFEDDASAPIKNPPQITAFMINGVSAVINSDTKAITIILPYGTDLKHVAPTIVTANASKVEPSSAQRVDLSTPKAYRVYASNGAYVTYTVTAYTEEPSPTQSLWEKLQNQINSNPNWWELAEYQKKTGYYK